MEWKNMLTYISLLVYLKFLHSTVLAELGDGQQKHNSRYMIHNQHNHNHAHHARVHYQHHNHRKQESILSHFDDLRRSQRPQNATTRLRLLNVRDYYNKVLEKPQNHHHHQRHSQHSEKYYNISNVPTNTLGSASTASRPSNGDDNSQDVEYIDVSGGIVITTSTTAKWPGLYSNRRSLGASTTTSTTTTAPPALIPARGGSASSTTSTHNPIYSQVTTEEGHIAIEGNFETNTIYNRFPPYKATDMERRHICVQQRVITMPVKTTEVYIRPVIKHLKTPCQTPTTPKQICTRVQLVHEQAARDVIRHKSAQSVTYDCCTGWTRENALTDDCMKPICASRCQNGGNCISPDTCKCPTGFKGHFCEQDINECQKEKPCDQICINTLGSYQCRCRDGFNLQMDRQSCRKKAFREEDAFEARDLENEVDIVPHENIAERLHKIERSLANEREQTQELQRSLQARNNVVDTLMLRLSKVEKHQLDINRLQSNFYVTESRTNKLESMLNLLLKCKNASNEPCP